MRAMMTVSRSVGGDARARERESEETHRASGDEPGGDLLVWTKRHRRREGTIVDDREGARRTPAAV